MPVASTIHIGIVMIGVFGIFRLLVISRSTSFIYSSLRQIIIK